MSCDLVTFPFCGAFAPCSDKQLKKQKHKTLRWAEDLQVFRDLQTAQDETLTQFYREWDAGAHRAEQDRSGFEPHLRCPGMVCSGQKLHGES